MITLILILCFFSFCPIPSRSYSGVPQASNRHTNTNTQTQTHFFFASFLSLAYVIHFEIAFIFLYCIILFQLYFFFGLFSLFLLDLFPLTLSFSSSRCCYSYEYNIYQTNKQVPSCTPSLGTTHMRTLVLCFGTFCCLFTFRWYSCLLGTLVPSGTMFEPLFATKYNFS